MRWAVPGIGPYAYDTRIPLRKHDGEWRVHWAPTLVHPKLERDTRLGTTRAPFERAPILDRDGVPIVRAAAGDAGRRGGGGGRGSRAPRPPGLARACSASIAARSCASSATAGPSSSSRRSSCARDDYAAVQGEVEAVPDVTAFDGTAPLSPTREFARGLLGTVAPVTAEQLERLGAGYAPGDQVGQAGLQARFERRLAGTPTRRVAHADARRRAAARDPVRARRPRADERSRPRSARGCRPPPRRRSATAPTRPRWWRSSPSTGDVLAVAERPVDSGFHRALEGRYPPGSTFKVVTTAALLRAGLDIERDRRLPAHDQRRGPRVSQLRGRRGRRRAVQPGLRPVVQHGLREPGRPVSRPDALTRTARDYGLGPTPRPARSAPRRPRSRPATTPSSGRRR